MAHIPRINWLGLTCGALVLWLTVICWCLYTQRPQAPAARGAVSITALEDAATAAVRADDAAAFQRLFRADSVGPHYAEQYFAQLFAYPVASLRLTQRSYEDLEYLVLRGEWGDRAICSAWSVQRDGGRSVLTAVPPLVNVCAATASVGDPPVARVDVHGFTA
ncbi:hypothetical protein [Streptomyces sp. S.PB5]|uniref:hypothetical protein n=1 Tax=Streptomyces sp. S.PB5 TaxID=3020844 RepID=UPI0025B011F6|nr:hypothetical protein [Streptomyces sp. S.PB5]MDN3027060.1 hypothetical protein [Streptomyces sp. S.PB5]